MQLDERWLTLTRGHRLLEIYEKRGNAYRLAFLKDRAGNQIAIDFDHLDRPYRVITGQAQLGLKYDERGHIVTISHHALDGERLATLAQYTYDEHGDLVAATDRYGNTRQYKYAHHLLTRYTDRTGRGMNLEWDGTGPKAKCFREYADDGSHEIRLAWHPNFRRVDVTDALGHVTQHYYDRKGYSFRICYPDGSEEWLNRDRHDNLTQYIHRDGTVEQFEYDARSNLLKHRRTDGSTVEMAYDEKDQLVRLTDPNGYVWHREYDDKGNLTVEIDPMGHKTEYSYNEQGLVTKVKDAKGGTKQLTYDESGALTRYTDCSGRSTKWKYDDHGRLVETKDADGGTTTIVYGANGQPAEIRSAAGVEQLSYDAEGRLRSHTDALKRTTQYRYDAAGRVASREDALGYKLGYRYDKLGRLTALTDANQATYSFQYDPVGRLLEEIGFDGKTTRYSYDEATGKLQSVDEAGQVTQLAYDDAGRLKKRSSGADEERFAYDPAGRLIDARNGHSHVQRFFDPAGRLVREHHAYRVFGEPRSYVWHHAYDEIGNRVKTVRPDGHTIDWLLYGSGHVHGMMLDGVERIQFERDNLHRETLRTFPSRVGQKTTYDPAGRISRRSVQREKAPMPFADRQYRYDAAGQLTRIEDADTGNTEYRYDPIGRLLEAIGPMHRERFAFDPASNIVDAKPAEREEKTAFERREENSLPPQVPKVMGNLLKHYAGMHFVYDARGNLIEKQSPAGEQRYEWDAFNRLKAATVKETSRQSEARYYYDPLGRRIAKEVNGERTVFGWDGDTLAYETKSDSGTHYVYEAGSFVPLAQFVTSSVTGIETPVWKPTDRYLPEEDPLQRVPQRTAEARVFYYHCDQIGTPLMMTDDVGDVVWEASYKAWGEARKVIERASKAAGITPRNPIRFQGQQHDDETGLAYNRHRYYDAASGRFVSQDPIGLHGGINVYAYARNSISWTDPLGLTSNESSPSTQAAGWQGKGNYPGVDAWSDAVLEKGTLVAHGAPGTSNFVTTVADVEASKGSRSAMFGSLQVAPHPERGFRPGMTVCELTADTAVTKSTVLANPQHGPGRAEQYFIPDEGLLNLKPLFSIPLTKQ
jgi:RHS repeat-associated protein